MAANMQLAAKLARERLHEELRRQMFLSISRAATSNPAGRKFCDNTIEKRPTIAKPRDTNTSRSLSNPLN